MKKYLPILLLWACNSSSEKASTIVVSEQPLNDSISLIVDSLKEWSENISDISSYAIKAQARIKQLEKEKQATEKEIEVYPMAMMSEDYKTDDRDRVIAELRKKVYDYENQIASLKNQLFREQVKVDRVPNKIEIEKPNDKSLVITLMGALEQGASVWIMESNRKSKKIMKGYYNCQVKDLNSLGAIQAKFYHGVYFFNDVPEGKYLIKVCALYGDWVEVKRKDGYQTVAMKVAPPIQ